MEAAKTAGSSPMAKKDAPAFKTILNSPYQLKCFFRPELNQHQVLNTTEIITRDLANIRLPSAKSKADKRLSATERKNRPSHEKVTTKSSNDAVTDTVEFNKEKRRQVVVGLNAVTRSLERDKLRACLVCLSVKPAALNHHILMLSAITSCPTLALPNLSKTVAPLLGLNSILALGIKKLLDGEKDYFGDLVEHISGTTSHFSLPWLTTTVPMLSSRTSQNKLSEVVGLQVPESPDSAEKRMERKRPCAGDKSKDMYTPLQVKTLRTKRKIKEKEGCKTVK